MVGISFRAPQELISEHEKALDLINLIRDIAQDSQTATRIKAASAALSAAQQLSEEDKKKLENARQIIANAQKLQDDFDLQRIAQEEKVNELYRKLEQDRNALVGQIAEFEKEKNKTQKAYAVLNAEATYSIEESNKIIQETKTRLEAITQKESSLLQREQELKENTDKLEKYRQDFLAEVDSRNVELEEKWRSLEAEKAAFEIKKKKLTEAIA